MKLGSSQAAGEEQGAPSSGHTHIQAEAPTTTAAETGVLDLQKWAGNRSVA